MPVRKEDYTKVYEALSAEGRQELYSRLTELISEERRGLFERLAPNRTRHITVVLEDVFQSHNASAVLRSCDCFGVQDVHIVAQRNQFTISSEVAMGSNKWVDYNMHRDIRETYAQLRAKGYRIVATLPHERDTLITDLDISQPTALVFGTELTGLTAEAVEGADSYVKIPMYGFTESFNISVATALSLFSLTERMRRGESSNWRLSEEELLALKLDWCIQTIRDGESVAREIVQQLLLGSGM